MSTLTIALIFLICLIFEYFIMDYIFENFEELFKSKRKEKPCQHK